MDIRFPVYVRTYVPNGIHVCVLRSDSLRTYVHAYEAELSIWIPITVPTGVWRPYTGFSVLFLTTGTINTAAYSKKSFAILP